MGEELKPSVCGVGINDAEYTVKINAYYTRKDGTRGQKLEWECPYYRVWRHMIGRCYSELSLKDKPSYLKTFVREEWLLFSNFKKWMEKQDWEGKQLDKDLLSNGGMEYSEDTCLFLDKDLNKFCRNFSVGETGASWHKRLKLFQVSVSNPITKEVEYLGSFSERDKAHRAWGRRKHELALLLAEEQTDINIKEALMKRYKVYE